MARQDKQQRLDQLMRLLERGLGFKAEALAQQLGISTRTFYTYLRQLQAAGHAIQPDGQGRYRLNQPEPEAVWQVPMHAHELTRLRDLLCNLKDDQGQLAALRHRLDHLTQPRAQSLNRWYWHLSEVLEAVYQGLQGQQQLILHRYRSGHGGQVRDRRVEPLALNDPATVLVCYEVDDQQVKNFQVNRIERATVLDTACGYDGLWYAPDFFGYSGPRRRLARLALDLYAYNHLLESYRDVEPYVQQVADRGRFCYRCEIEFCHPEGIGRYLLAMAGHVRVLAPRELRQYVRVQGGTW